MLNLQRQMSRLVLLIVGELLFEVFSQRYARGSILVTTNLPFDEWTEVFGSERLTGALLDRLTHHVHILEMNGDSYRIRHSRQSAASPRSRTSRKTPDSLQNCGPLLLTLPHPAPNLVLSHPAGGTRFLRRSGTPSRRPCISPVRRNSASPDRDPFMALRNAGAPAS